MNVINKVTLKTLKKNKTRTIVTIIGVILSAAMIAAVTTFISSLQTMLVNSSIAAEGRWQASISQISYQDISTITDNAGVKETGIQHTLGYAKLDGSCNPSKPYLFIQEFDQKSMELYAFHLKEGRLPDNDREVMISEQINTDGGAAYSIGDTITLNIGDRIDTNGTAMTQNNPFSSKGFSESLFSLNKRSFTIVGIIEKPSYEPFSAPGYSVVTCLNTSLLKATDKVNATFCIKNPKEIFSFAPNLASQVSLGSDHVSLHKALLEYMGYSQSQNYKDILYPMGVILIVMIMIGSISLIYNAFAISISERSKQFGMLSGVGATSRQIRNSVFFEASLISLIGIPIGILSGIFGIGVTLYLLRGSINSLIDTNVPFTVSVSVPSIAIAAVVGFVTILISAWVPARRASRVSPIESIRENRAIKIKRKNVRTSHFIRRLFGMEGDIALKNFKRNRRRYRTTIISLFISIVLFISASSLTMYLKAGVETIYANVNYDISLTSANPDTPFSEDENRSLTQMIKSMDNYERFTVIRGLQGSVSVDPSLIRPDLLKGDKPDVTLNSNGTAALAYQLYTVSDEEFKLYADRMGLDLSEYTDTSHPKGIAYDKQRYYDRHGKLQGGNLFISQPKSALDLHNSQFSDENDTAHATTSLQIGAVADDTPLGVEANNYTGDSFIIIVSNKVYSACFSHFPEEDRIPLSIGIKTSKPNVVYENLQTELRQQGFTNVTINNIANMLQMTRSVLSIANVFTYGFITLITLITIANVFNTISTNVNLRRREFAMLKSVGMTSEGFHRMINFECIFYGLKALLYSLPVSFFITVLIYKTLSHTIGVSFHIPWLNILFCILAVFLIVFITMMYSMAKVRKENIVTALKNENL